MASRCRSYVSEYVPVILLILNSVTENREPSIYAEDAKGINHSYIVMPALVYGVSTSPFKTYSNQIPKLTDLALGRGQAGKVGKGLSR